VDTRAAVYRFDEVAYFIGNNPAGHPGLYRSSSNSGTEELVENVEDMDIVYGIDTSSPADGIADSYVSADAVTDWSQVVSVRISLLVVGQDSSVTTGTQTYILRDTDGDGILDAQSAPDSRLRQVFTSTIALRNRVL
jgi:type IV pilus assembly protein PilW